MLRAYNTYCQPGYIVRPVKAIDEFAINNPAPDNSTGWFLPSPKELHILCNKDVDDIVNNSGTDTRNIINSSLTAVGGDGLKNEFYWSSGEYSNFYAWLVYLGSGSVNYYNKYSYSYVRLVFAF